MEMGLSLGDGVCGSFFQRVESENDPQTPSPRLIEGAKASGKKEELSEAYEFGKTLK